MSEWHYHLDEIVQPDRELRADEDMRRMQVSGTAHPRDKPLDTSRIGSIRMGTTVRSGRHPPRS